MVAQVDGARCALDFNLLMHKVLGRWLVLLACAAWNWSFVSALNGVGRLVSVRDGQLVA